MKVPDTHNIGKNPPALFLHIQKTAGTSIIAVARQYYGDSLTSHGDCWGRRPEDLKDVGFVSGHIGYDFAKSLMAGRASFTFLRNPVERVLSMYYFCKNGNPNDFTIYKRANELDLERFLQAGFTDSWVKKNIWNNQVWQLAHGYAHLDKRTINEFSEADLLNLAKSHLKEFTYVGFTETVDQDCLKIFAALKFPKFLLIPKVNVTLDRPGASELSANNRALLEALTRLDRQLYDYAWELFKPKEI